MVPVAGTSLLQGYSIPLGVPLCMWPRWLCHSLLGEERPDVRMFCIRYSGKGVLLDIIDDKCVDMVLTCAGGIRRALGLLLSFPVYLCGVRGVFPVFDVGFLAWLVRCCMVTYCLLYVGGTHCVCY